MAFIAKGEYVNAWPFPASYSPILILVVDVMHLGGFSQQAQTAKIPGGFAGQPGDDIPRGGVTGIKCR